MTLPTLSSIHENNSSVKSNTLKSPPFTQNSFKGVIHYSTNKTLIDSSEYLPKDTPLPELKETAVDMLKLAGYFTEADKIEECGHSFTVYQCEECGKRPARVFHCDHRLCPLCYYRHLLRFFRAHRASWEGINPITITAISYGTWLTDDIELALKEANAIHQKLFQGFWRANGGVYHIEAVLTNDGTSYELIYHYMLDCHRHTLLFLGLKLHGRGRLIGVKSFGNYETAYRYFIKHHCHYPTSIVIREDLLRGYLTTLKHRRLIQGFGSLYRVSGGRGKSQVEKVEYKCPFCGGKCKPYFKCSVERVAWSGEYKTFYNP